MKIDRIQYQRVFAIGNYVTERIGLEAGLDDKEDPQTALEHLKIMVNQLHAETLSSLEETRGTQVRAIEPVDKTIEGIIEDINACVVVDEKNGLGVQVGLLAYEPICKQYPEIKDAYLQKMLELTRKNQK